MATDSRSAGSCIPPLLGSARAPAQGREWDPATSPVPLAFDGARTNPQVLAAFHPRRPPTTQAMQSAPVLGPRDVGNRVHSAIAPHLSHRRVSRGGELSRGRPVNSIATLSSIDALTGLSRCGGEYWAPSLERGTCAVVRRAICWVQGHDWRYDRHLWGSGLQPSDRFVCQRCGNEAYEASDDQGVQAPRTAHETAIAA